MSLRVWRYWKLPQGGQLNKLTQLSSKLPIPTLDSEVFPPCTASAQVCTYVHKYARSGMFTAPRSLRAPHMKLSWRKPINSETNKGWRVHTVGCQTGRGRVNHSCMEQGRWMSQRKDVRHQTAYCLNKLHTTSFSLQHKTMSCCKYPILLTRRLGLRELGSHVYIRLLQTMCYCLYSSGTGLQTEFCCANLNFLPTEHQRLFIKVNGPWSWISGAWKLGEKCFR